MHVFNPLIEGKIIAIPNHCKLPVTDIEEKGLDIEHLHLTLDDQYGVITCPSIRTDYQAPCYGFFYDGSDPTDLQITRIDELLNRYDEGRLFDLNYDILPEKIHRDTHDPRLIRISLVGTSAKTGHQQAAILSIKTWTTEQ